MPKTSSEEKIVMSHLLIPLMFFSAGTLLSCLCLAWENHDLIIRSLKWLAIKSWEIAAKACRLLVAKSVAVSEIVRDRLEQAWLRYGCW